MTNSISNRQLDTPILLIIFNRAEITRKSMEAIRKVRPKQLFLAADGPRSSKPGEDLKCRQTREMALSMVDWDCKVETLFRDHNLGCGLGPVSGMDWFFGEVEEGIVLEDDCMPNESFFWFCQEILEKYRDDERIMLVSGMNRMEKWNDARYDYFFSYYGSTWGWASWRRAWKYNDFQMKLWGDPLVQQMILDLVGIEQYRVVSKDFQKTFEGYDEKLSVWDYQWNFARLVNHGLAIVPSKNMITNVGFGDDATHTTEANEMSNIPKHEMQFPLRHNPIVLPDKQFDHIISFADEGKLWKKAYRKMGRMLKIG